MVTKINNIEVHSIIDLNKVIRDTFSGDAIDVTYTRDDLEYSSSIPVGYEQ